MDLVIRNFLQKKFVQKWCKKLVLSGKIDDLVIFQKNGIVCRNCGKKQKIVQNENYLSFLCKCGMRIYYPPDKDGVVVTKFISRIEYDAKHKENGKKGIE